MTRTSTILQLLLFGGEKEWAKDPLAASTLVQMGKLTERMTEIMMTLKGAVILANILMHFVTALASA